MLTQIIQVGIFCAVSQFLADSFTVGYGIKDELLRRVPGCDFPAPCWGEIILICNLGLYSSKSFCERFEKGNKNRGRGAGALVGSCGGRVSTGSSTQV